MDRIWCVADAGLVVNPDGACNQLEGGIVQAVSWTLKEQVRLDELGIASRDWDSYPILRFSEIPEMQVEFVDGAGQSRSGCGRMLGRTDGGRHRQCRRPRAGRSHPRHAAHPRAHHGGPARGIGHSSTRTGERTKFLPAWNVLA